MNGRFWYFRPLAFGKAVFVFARDWWFSRPLASLLRGLPALLVIVGMGALIALGAQGNEQRLIKRYKLASKTAIEQEDFTAAEIYFRKLAILEPDNSRHRFMQGLIAEKEEDLPRARRIIRRLAPREETRYAPAHFWVALDYVKSQAPLDSNEAKVVKLHLLRAVEAEPRYVEAHALLAELYTRENLYDRAAPHIEIVAQQRPAALLLLANVYIRLGQQDLARERAESASRFFSAISRRAPANVRARLLWAEALLLQQEFQRAADALGKALTQTNDQRYRQMLARVLSKWSDELPEEQIGQRLELIQRAVMLAPNDPTILKRLMPFAALDSPHGEQVRSRLGELLARGEAVGAVHLVLGTAAAQNNDMEQALMHLEQAYQHNPRMVPVVNNLAWILANKEPPQTERALQLASAAVNLAPGNAEARETRGSIHVKLGNWKEAIVDLELALEKFEGRAAIHEKLAQAYEGLGQHELAANHRELLKAGKLSAADNSKPSAANTGTPAVPQPQ